MNDFTHQRIDPGKGGLYDNSEVDFTKPVQFGCYDQRRGGTEWVDCVVDPGGTMFRAGICGTGKQFFTSSWPFRNTPLTSPEDIDKWYVDALAKLNQQHYDLKVKAEQRKGNVLYKGEASEPA